MKKGIERLGHIVVSMGILALTLSGCYFVDGSMNMEDADGDLRIEFDLKQGVETALFNPEENAREYVISRFGSPWRYVSTSESFPYTVVEFGQSARVTKNGVAHRFKDKHGNEISVVWADTEYRMEFRVSLMEPFENSNLDPQVTFGWIAPEGWRTNIRSSGNGSAIVGQNSVAWYGETGDDVVVIGLQPPQVRMLPAPEPEAEEEQPDPAPEEEANVPAPGNEASPQPAPQQQEESPLTGQEEGENETTTETTETGETLPDTSESSTSELIGTEGVAVTTVSGEPGLVDIDSEFFPAIAINNEEIRAGSEIRVIGVFTEGVLVEPLNPQESGFNLWFVGGIVGAIVLVMAGIGLLVLRKKASAQQEQASEN